MKKHILITGDYGLVGSAAREFFHDKGWGTWGMDNNQRSKMFGTKKMPESIQNIDIRNLEQVEEHFKFIKKCSEHWGDTLNAVIHAAAQPSHDYATDHIREDFEINTVGTLNLLEMTKKYFPEAVFIYVSTDKVYGENLPSDKLATESDGLDFAGIRSFFGCSKTAADIYVQEYGNRFGMKTACFRPGCITGKNHQGAEQHGFLAYVAKCVRENKPYTIFANTIRDQIHAKDLASAFYEFIENPKIGAVYNMGGGPERAISVREAIEKCEEIVGNKIEVKEGTKRPGDRMYDVHDVSKFRADYPNWDYTYSLQDILDDVCAK